MKKLFLVLMFIGIATISYSQRTLAVDTLQGAETVSFAVMQNAEIITATCTQLGGTSDGTLTLYGSLTGTDGWVFLNFIGGKIGISSPKASITGADLNQITITNALEANWVIDKTLFPFTKVVGAGTTADTTSVQIVYSK